MELLELENVYKKERVAMLFQLPETGKPTSIYCILPGTITVCAKGITSSRETTLHTFYQVAHTRNLCQMLVLCQESSIANSRLLALSYLTVQNFGFHTH